MLGQEEHDLANFLLLLPTLADSLDPLLPNTLDVHEEVWGLLEDFESPLLVDADDLGGDLRPDGPDRTRSKVLFDTFCRSWVSGLEFVGLELLAVLPIHNPLASGLKVFPSRNRSRAADDRHQVGAPLTTTLRTAKPFSGLWKVTRSISPLRDSGMDGTLGLTDP